MSTANDHNRTGHPPGRTRLIDHPITDPATAGPGVEHAHIGPTVPSADTAAGSAPPGAAGFYWGAAMSLLVSVDTSWRFFAQVLRITALWERSVMFAVLEVALIACGYGMRANVIRTGRPGAPRVFAWLLCALAAFMAWQLSGVTAGIARVALGPVLGLVMLHLALGIEIRTGMHHTTAWARIGRELRERALSRLGLSDDGRDALARTRDRAARRAARLTLATWVPLRSARVARALRASNVAHDPAARARMLAELAAIRHANDLSTLDQPSPWHDPVTTGTGNLAANTTPPVRDPAPDRAPRTPREHRRTVRGTNTGAGRTTRGQYLAQARAAYTPGVEVSPAWVRSVTTCSRATSKHVADALNAEHAAALTQRGTGLVAGGGEQ